jgi:hypothetical protein
LAGGSAVPDADLHRLVNHHTKTTADTSGSFLSVALAALGAQTPTVTTTVVTRNFLVVPDSGAVLINPTLWETNGALRKQWTIQPSDGPTPQAVSATANIHYKVGDLSPNTSYMVLKDGRELSPVMSDSTGGATFADVPGTTGTVGYAIVVNDQPPLPTVTVAANDANASESGPDTGTFTIGRTGSTASALTVNYSLSGTAANGVDYQFLSGSVTIPAGAASANIVVRPIDDRVTEVAELVILTLSADSAYNVSTLNTAIVTILDNDLLFLGTEDRVDAK